VVSGRKVSVHGSELSACEGKEELRPLVRQVSGNCDPARPPRVFGPFSRSRIRPAKVLIICVRRLILGNEKRFFLEFPVERTSLVLVALLLRQLRRTTVADGSICR
jgi:hypothetical protein